MKNKGGKTDGGGWKGVLVLMLQLPFFVIGMFVHVLMGEIVWGDKGGACDAYAKSATKAGLLIVGAISLAAVAAVKSAGA